MERSHPPRVPAPAPVPARRPGAASRTARILVAVVALALLHPSLLPAQREARDLLTHDQAVERKARLGNIRYVLSMDLTTGDREFTGAAVIGFDLRDPDRPLTLDFSGGEVEAVEINAKPWTVPYNGYFLTLPAAALRAGSNIMRIRYRHPYTHDGTGLHRFTDPEDGLVYTYSYLWPYYANRVFPAFDQPDLKAVFDLTAEVPSGWTVISAAPGRRTGTSEGGDTWIFDPTPLMSTYVFSLHAGPYQMWEDRSGEVPIRLFARRSLAEFVPAEEWLDVTRRGLAFYGEYFDIPYPFRKYDQILVPDFAIGAMENVAAVTFNESYAPSRPADRFQRRRRAGTILHEMAHMWFGDLVTKQWWNALWLNESFATLMSNLAQSGATEFTDAWYEFFIDSKQAAYAKDSRVTTHPIDVPVNSTADFFLVFDAITYQKGSSVLKQLAHFVGEENFRRGVSAYLKQHAYGNTTLEDFMAAQTQASGRNLDAWTREWLYSPGFDLLRVRLECGNDVVSRLVVEQSPQAEDGLLRTHRVDVALYGNTEKGLEPLVVFPVEVAGPETKVPEAVGLPCPELVYPNHGDWGYARVVLDARSAAMAQSRLEDIVDPWDRSLFLQSLADAALAGTIPLEDYAMLAVEAASRETDLRVLSQLTGSLETVIGTLERLRPDSDAVRDRVLPRVLSLAVGQGKQETDPDRGALWFTLLVASSRGDEGIRVMRSLLTGETSFPAVVISRDRRWELIAALSARGFPGAADLIAGEKARDPSDAGEKMALAAEASRPDLEVKRRWLTELVDDHGDLGLSRQRAVMAFLFPDDQTALELDLLDEMLAALPALGETRDPYFVSSYVRSLLAPIGRETSAAAFRETLADPSRFTPTALVFLREASQADDELLRLRRVMSGAEGAR